MLNVSEFRSIFVVTLLCDFWYGINMGRTPLIAFRYAMRKAGEQMGQYKTMRNSLCWQTFSIAEALTIVLLFTGVWSFPRRRVANGKSGSSSHAASWGFHPTQVWGAGPPKAASASQAKTKASVRLDKPIPRAVLSEPEMESVMVSALFPFLSSKRYWFRADACRRSIFWQLSLNRSLQLGGAPLN